MAKDFTGQRYWHLTAVQLIEQDSNNGNLWLFKCDCGEGIARRINNVRRGTPKSCGCMKKQTERARPALCKADVEHAEKVKAERKTSAKLAATFEQCAWLTGRKPQRPKKGSVYYAGELNGKTIAEELRLAETLELDDSSFE